MELHTWLLQQFNVKNSFPCGGMKEVYMDLSPRLSPLIDECIVFKITKALCKLKPCPYVRFKRFNSDLKNYGYTFKLVSNFQLYSLVQERVGITIMIAYVEMISW